MWGLLHANESKTKIIVLKSSSPMEVHMVGPTVSKIMYTLCVSSTAANVQTTKNARTDYYSARTLDGDGTKIVHLVIVSLTIYNSIGSKHSRRMFCENIPRKSCEFDWLPYIMADNVQQAEIMSSDGLTYFPLHFALHNQRE